MTHSENSKLSLTIGQRLNITEFPFEIKDKYGNIIYIEREDGYWEIRKFNEDKKQVFHQNQNGFWAEEGYHTTETKRIFDEIFGKKN
jgi:hypothetical protein